MCLTNLRVLYAPVSVVKAIWLPCIGTFFEKINSKKNMIPIPLLVFHFARDFGNAKSLEYDDLENIKTDRVNAVGFNLHQIKFLKFFWGHSV